MNYILLMRPFNIAFVLISVYYGAIYQKGVTFSLPLLFAMLSAACIAGAGYAVNDVFDFAIDKINKPKRVLPSEKIPLKSAYFFLSWVLRLVFLPGNFGISALRY
jgi:geranylgeranylglycerol-phosphate geranylgeranyltransferase